MKRLTGIFLLLVVLSISAAGKNPDVKLRFDKEGKFKIVQFTDIHFRYNTPRSDSVLTIIRTILKEEAPDIAIITGDVVTSKNTRQAWLQLTEPFVQAKIPWAITLGNHDDESEMNREQIISLVSELPYCLTVEGPEDLSGSGNYILEVVSSQSEKPAALLYCLDSNAYSRNEAVPGYDWFKFDQVEWYRKQSEKLAKANEKPLPALAFFHIPLPEYWQIINKKTTVGIAGEDPCSPAVNSGMFTAMLEKQDVMGMFVGHDHDNNYIGTLYGLCMAYGCKTGMDSYGKHEKGARVIVLHENQRKFDTWIRSMNKEPQYFVTYPDSFPEEKKQK